MALIVLIGILPGPFLDRIRPSVAEIDKNLQSQRRVMKGVAETSIPPVVHVSTNGTPRGRLR